MRTTFEYGVVHYRIPEELHRGWWTEDEARSWIAEGEEDGFSPGVFLLVRREVGDMELVDADPDPR